MALVNTSELVQIGMTGAMKFKMADDEFPVFFFVVFVKNVKQNRQRRRTPYHHHHPHPEKTEVVEMHTFTCKKLTVM